MKAVKNNPWAFTTVAITVFAVAYIGTVHLTGAAEASVSYSCPVECNNADCPHAQ